MICFIAFHNSSVMGDPSWLGCVPFGRAPSVSVEGAGAGLPAPLEGAIAYNGSRRRP